MTNETEKTQKHKRKSKQKQKETRPLVDLHLLLHTTIHQHTGLLLLAQTLLAMNTVGSLVLVQNQRLALLALPQLLADEVLARGNHLAVCLALAVAGQLSSQTTLGEDTLAALSDLLHTLHGLDGGGDQVAVVLDGDVALLGELGQDEGGVDDHLLATGGTVALSPLQLAGLTLHLEVLVAL